MRLVFWIHKTLAQDTNLYGMRALVLVEHRMSESRAPLGKSFLL